MCRVGAAVFLSFFLLFGIGCSSLNRSGESSIFRDCIVASGVAKVDARRYIVVNDTEAGVKGPRIGLIEVDRRENPRYLELAANWEDVGGPSHKLESVCAIPGRPGEFLAAESGYVGERYGRLFHFRLDRDGRNRSSASLIHVLPLPRLYDRIEGMTVGRTRNDQLILVIGERGSRARAAKLSWGRLQLTEEGMSFGIEDDFDFRSPGPGREEDLYHCSDLFIDAQNRLWAASTSDGDPHGPFRSVIYRLGDFDARRRRPVMSLDPLAVTWTVEGFRVKAIGPAPDDPQSLCFISDDEELGGVWRPLVRPRGRFEP